MEWQKVIDRSWLLTRLVEVVWQDWMVEINWLVFLTTIGRQIPSAGLDSGGG